MQETRGPQARNKYVAAALVVAILVLSLLVVHVTRYEPISAASGFSVLVWDRWLHRLCLAIPTGIECFSDIEHSESPPADPAKTASTSQIEIFQSAGFSDTEILEWVEGEIASYRNQNRDDEELARHLFGGED